MEEILKEINKSLKQLHDKVDHIEERVSTIEKQNIQIKDTLEAMEKTVKEEVVKNENDRDISNAVAQAILEVGKMLESATKMIANLPKKLLSEKIADVDFEQTDKWNVKNPNNLKKIGRVEKYIDPKTKEVKTKMRTYTLKEALERIFDMNKYIEKASKDLIEVAKTQRLHEVTQYKTNLRVLSDLELILLKVQAGVSMEELIYGDHIYMKAPHYGVDERTEDKLTNARIQTKNRAIDTIERFEKEGEDNLAKSIRMNISYILGKGSKGYRKAYSEEINDMEDKKIDNLQRKLNNSI